MMDFYYWETCTDSAKVMICLNEKGLEFTGHFVDILALEQYSREFLAMNPAGQVPVLVHDKQVLTDSTIINEYLDDAFPSPSLAPRDARGWYDVLCWGKYLDYNLGPSVSMLGWQQVMAPVLRERNAMPDREALEGIPVPERKAAWLAAADDYPEDQLANSRRKIELAVRRMEEALSHSLWLAGPDYSIVDIDAFALSHTLPRLAPDIVNDTATPKLVAWMETIHARPAVKATLSMRRSSLADDVYAPGPEHSRWG